MAKTDEGTAQDAGLTVDEGAERLFGLLNEDGASEEDTPGDVEEEEVEAEDDAEDGEDDADDEDDVDRDTESDTDDDLEDEEDEDEDADDEPSDSSLPQTVTVKVDGEEVEVPLEEALAGYSRTQDYTRKTMALAEERQKLQAEEQEIAEIRATYAQQLEVVEQALALPEMDWDQVKKDNPGKYAEIRAAYDERKAQLDSIKAHRAEVMEEQAKAAAKAAERTREVEQEKLFAAIPDWADEDLRKQEAQEMVQVATTTYGFSPKDLENVLDHRALVMLRDAMLYRRGLDKQETVRKKAKANRKKTPTLEPATVPAKPKKGKKQVSRKRFQAARKNLADTGRVDDAAAALLELLDD